MNNSHHYQALYDHFRWLVPPRFNIAEACCTRWAISGADARRMAIYTETESGARDIWTFERLHETANRLSQGLRRMGVAQGHTVALILPQRGETAAAHMALYQMGAIAVPLSPRLNPEALEKNLRDSDARIAIIDPSSHAALLSILHRCPTLKQLVGIDIADEHTLPWRSLLARQSPTFTRAVTSATDPALLLYDYAPAIDPKGVLLSHAALIGALPGFVAAHDWFPRAGDVFWSPADWATSTGLLGALLPTLYFGRPIVAAQGRFTGHGAFNLLERYGVTSALLYPAAIAAMMQAEPQQPNRRLALRSLASTGETLTNAMSDWCHDILGAAPNEFYGQREMQHVIGNSRHKWPPRAGSLGLPFPGHRIALIDEAGNRVAPDAIGEIALNRFDIHGHPDPSLFLGYWRKPAATQERFIGDWYRSGDLARVDADGYYWHEGRIDDRFTAAGHDINPYVVESRLREHAAVAQAAVVPRPYGAHTSIKAYVVPAEPYTTHATSYLMETLKQHARDRLPAHEQPAEFEFVDVLPTSLTGQVQRAVLRQRDRQRLERRRPRAKTGEAES